LMYDNDTIAAISTPYGTGGIGIIRVSGDKAFEIVGKIFKGKKDVGQFKSHTINYGKIKDPLDDSIIDEVLLTKMDKPITFTRENVVEINCHSGITILKKILELLIREGARPAEPGEFTKRAFLNGRIDLAQAEAVIDIINARTLKSSKVALQQLEGKLSEKIKNTRNNLVELIAKIEVTLDYPEEDVDKITEQEVYNSLIEIRRKLMDLLSSFKKGRIIRDGISAVIVGRPNVGKSSLLNELTGQNRAIVTEVPGTTRDIIEEYINISGIPVKLLDTAGIRETGDIVEKIGVDLTKKAIEAADLVIMMIDAAEGFTEEDEKILKILQGKKIIILTNKIDLKNDVSHIPETDGISIIKTSMTKGIGIDQLENEITRLFLSGNIFIENEGLVTNLRHANLIEKAIKSVDNGISAYNDGMPLDCMTVDIRNAVHELGEITGESINEDIINEIFSRFCIGK